MTKEPRTQHSGDLTGIWCPIACCHLENRGVRHEREREIEREREKGDISTCLAALFRRDGFCALYSGQIPNPKMTEVPFEVALSDMFFLPCKAILPQHCQWVGVCMCSSRAPQVVAQVVRERRPRPLVPPTCIYQHPMPL